MQLYHYEKCHEEHEVPQLSEKELQLMTYVQVKVVNIDWDRYVMPCIVKTSLFEIII